MDRPDTLIRILDAQHGIIAGYSVTRNHRDLHGGFCDGHSELSFKLFKQNPIIPAINLATVQGKPEQKDIVGYVSSWKADVIGLWTEVQLCQSPGIASIWQAATSGRLYLCFKHYSSECEVDQATGYFRKKVGCAVNLTEYPTYRPSRWEDAWSYLDYLLETVGSLPNDDEHTVPFVEQPNGVKTTTDSMLSRYLLVSWFNRSPVSIVFPSLSPDETRFEADMTALEHDPRVIMVAFDDAFGRSIARYGVRLIPFYHHTLSPLDAHPNAEGHREIAASLLPIIREAVSQRCSAVF